MLWFKHDTDAYIDDRIQSLRITAGGAAVDAYYAFLEEIYRTETALVLGENQPRTKVVLYRLCADWETLKNWFSTMAEIGLLNVVENDDRTYTLQSRRANDSVEDYRRKVETARANGAKGGRPPKAKPKRNQRKTKSVNSANQDKTETKPNKDKECISDSHKGYPNIHAEHGADAGGPAPRSARRCPKCYSEMKPTATYTLGKKARIWRCVQCDEEVAVDE